MKFKKPLLLTLLLILVTTIAVVFWWFDGKQFNNDNPEVIAINKSFEKIERKDFITDSIEVDSILYEGLREAKSYKNDSLLAEVYGIIGVKYIRTDNFKKAVTYFDSAIAVCPIHNYHSFSRAYQGLAIIHERWGEVKESIEYSIEAFNYLQKSKRVDGIHQWYNTVAIILFSNNLISESRNLFKLSISLLKQTDPTDYYKFQELYGNVALSYITDARVDSTQQNYDTTLLYYDSALMYVNKLLIKAKEADLSSDEGCKQFDNAITNYTTAHSVVQSNIANVYSDLKQYAKSLELSNDALEKLLLLNNEIPFTYKLLQKMGRIYSELQDEANTRRILKLLYQLEPNAKQNNFTKALRERRYLMYYSIGEKDSAFKISHRCNELFFQIVQEQILLSFTTKLSENKTLIKNQELEIIKQQKELEDKELDFKNTLIIAGLFLTLIISVALINYVVTGNKLSKANKDLQINQSKLEEIINEKNSILEIVAHDLRSPLAGIKGINNLMMMGGLSPDEQTMMLNKIEQLCNTTDDIIRDIIDAIRITEIQALPLEPIDVNYIVECALAVQSPQQKKKKIEVLWQKGNSILANLNEEKMIRAVSNLISNAIKFSHEGKNIQIWIEENTNSTVSIHIKDEGIGIPKDMIPILFDRFTKASRNGTKGEKSVGLGMSIVKKIVEMNHGSIQVVSEENIGTTMIVTLPKILS